MAILCCCNFQSTYEIKKNPLFFWCCNQEFASGYNLLHAPYSTLSGVTNAMYKSHPHVQKNTYNVYTSMVICVRWETIVVFDVIFLSKPARQSECHLNVPKRHRIAHAIRRSLQRVRCTTSTTMTTRRRRICQLFTMLSKTADAPVLRFFCPNLFSIHSCINVNCR